MNQSKARRIKIIVYTMIVLVLFISKIQAQADSFNIRKHTDTLPYIDTAPPLRIAVLAPLYLDSAFDDFYYKLGNINIPKYFLPGLEFYNGIMAAIDSLQQQGNNLDVWIFDTKKKGLSSEALAAEMNGLHFSLIIASLTNPTEQKTFSDFSLNNNIPLISATYPNDANVTGNPFFVMINSSLKTHVDGIYKYLQKNFLRSNLIFVTRQGALEDRIRSMFTDLGKISNLLTYKTVLLTDNFTADHILSQLDSTKQNVIICGSINEYFGANLIKTLNLSATYPITLIGMPTWGSLKILSTANNENLDIVYSSPFNYSTGNQIIIALTSAYKSKYNARPSEMFFKGYESMYHFGNLLSKFRNNFINNLSDTTYNVSNNFFFAPVKQDSASFIPDYIENKKLYFVRKWQGNITTIY